MKPVLLRRFLFALLVAALVGTNTADAQRKTSKLPPFPNDMSIPGLRAMKSQSNNPALKNAVLPEEVENRVRDYVYEMRKQGLTSRSGVLSVSAAPTNVRANDPTGDRVGETQAEVAVAVFGDTVVVGWNDSRGFLAGGGTGSPGPPTLSSYGYSIDGGATFTDGGDVPLAAAGDQAFGDPGIDTDEQGNWYYNQIYTRPGQQNIGVHHGRFVAGVLVWDTPVMADVAVTTTSAMDKCLLACDRVTGNVYVAATRFTTTIPQIEIVRSTTHGATWDAPIVLDNTTTPTSSKQAARPFCGPNGEVYVVWEKGANVINCPDPTTGDVSNTTGVIAFTRSLNFGVSYDPFITIGTVDHSWTWSGPGDLRERANDFPDIAVDRSGGPFNGNIYVTWHESAPWTSNLTAGTARAEAADAANNNPGGAELFNIGEDVNGSISSNADLDYWQFSATQGQSFLFNLDPQGFVCGVSGTSRGMRMRLFATQSPYPNPTGFPDSLLAASALGAFAQRIVWIAPKTGTYLVRLQRSSGVAPFTYRLRVRNLTFGAPNPARDARDVVIVRSTNQGASWSAEQLINDDPAGLENRRPFICVDGLGHVHAFWHDSRTPGLGSNASLTSIFGTTSRDGGNTWTPNYNVTDELSFFSFNTRAVPNLGDYNQAAATTNGMVYPAWSDQRLSTGDVRTPGTNTFTAGFGPETYTTKISFDFTTACPADTTIYVANPITRTFRITNTGNVPDNYSYTVTDDAGLLSGATSGTTGPLQPGATASVTVTVTPSAVVYDNLNFAVTPVGDPGNTTICTTKVTNLNFVFLTEEYIHSNGHRASEGNLHTNGTINFYTGRPSLLKGNLQAGNTIIIRANNIIDGNVTAGVHLSLIDNAKVTGTANVAPVPNIPLPVLAFTAGGDDITVGEKKSRTLPPGSYGDVKVSNGGKLFLTSGEYFMDALVLTSSSLLTCDITAGPITVNVVGNFRFGEKARVVITPSGPMATLQVRFNALTTGGVEIAARSLVRGFIIAPNSLVALRQDSQFKGAIFADKIHLGSGVAFFHHGSANLTKPDDEQSGEEVTSNQSPVTSYDLAQNYPNPFNPSTMFSFALPEAGKVTLNIFNETGQLVRRLVDREMPAGRQTLRWNSRDQSGKLVAAGVYLYRIVVTGANGEAAFTETKRMTLLK